VLLGTTDIFHEGELDDPRASAEEVGYLLRVARHVFPGHDLALGDVVGAFAGLRPILVSDAATPSAASREEAIWEEAGLFSVAGGKLTTYRATAEKVVDRVLAALPGDRRGRVAPSVTAGTSLVGLAPPDLAGRLTVRAGVGPEVAAGMARRLGGSSWGALDLARSRKELLPLGDGLDLCAAEVRCHLRYGAVLHLEDLLLRRVRLGMWDPPAARRLAPRLRRLFADELGWGRRRWWVERQRFEANLEAWTPEGAR
jgi:glycerol-3-phosphate dehydrogenase